MWNQRSLLVTQPAARSLAHRTAQCANGLDSRARNSPLSKMLKMETHYNRGKTNNFKFPFQSKNACPSDYCSTIFYSWKRCLNEIKHAIFWTVDLILVSEHGAGRSKLKETNRILLNEGGCGFQVLCSARVAPPAAFGKQQYPEPVASLAFNVQIMRIALNTKRSKI